MLAALRFSLAAIHSLLMIVLDLEGGRLSIRQTVALVDHKIVIANRTNVCTALCTGSDSSRSPSCGSSISVSVALCCTSARLMVATRTMSDATIAVARKPFDLPRGGELL